MNDPVAILKRSALWPSAKSWWRVHLVISALPLTWALLMCLYGLYARSSLGHWPRPMTEAVPQNYFSQFLEASTSLLYLPAIYSVVVWGSIMLWQWAKYSKRQRLQHISLYIAGSMALLAVVWGNPGQFFDWWID